MDATNIQLTQMEVIRRVLNVSDIKLLDKIKDLIDNNKELVAYSYDEEITPVVKEEIEEARREYQRGESLCFKDAAEAQKWMDSL